VHPSTRSKRPARRAAAKSSANRRTGNGTALDALLLALYRGVREPDGWLDFQRHLSLQLATINSVLSLRWPEGTRPGLLYTFNGDTARLPPELRAYAAIDPFVNIADGRAVRLLDLVDPAEFRASTYYREWLVPIDVEYALGLDVREAGRFHARLRLCRSKSAGEFTDADCRLVESLAPHLRLAVGLYSDLDEARSGRELYADAMDSLTLATIVLRKRALSSASSLAVSAYRRQQLLGGAAPSPERQLLLPLADEDPLADLVGTTALPDGC